MDFEKKLPALTGEMKADGLGLLLVGTGTDLEYLTGLSSMACERFKALAILQDGRHFFICPELYYEETRQALGEAETMFVWSDGDGFLKAIREADQTFGLQDQTIGVSDVIRAIDMLGIQSVVQGTYVDGSPVMERLRQVKTAEEVELMKASARIADQVAEEIVAFIRPGMKEKDIADRIKALFIEKGAEDISFEPIVASGPNSSMPHYHDDQRVIQEQDIIVLDFGGRYKGYCSDMSRTVFVGQPTEEQIAVYNIVRRANTEAELLAKAGVTAHEVDKRARDIIKEAGYGHCFLNRTGHGIGMAIHEAPYIKEGNQIVLENGMAFSVEPGIYIAGKFGMRIENIVIIEKGQGTVLNQFTKEMLIL